MNENEKTFSVEEGMGKGFWFSVDAILITKRGVRGKKKKQERRQPILCGETTKDGPPKFRRARMSLFLRCEVWTIVMESKNLTAVVCNGFDSGL